MPRRILPALGFLFALLGWELAGRELGDAILAPPSSVAFDYSSLLQAGDMLRELALSLRHMALGYGAACLVGMPLGIAMGRSRTADAIAHPWVAMMVVTSTAALIPLLILVLGTGLWLRVVVVFLAAVFYIVLTGTVNLWSWGRDGARSGRRARSYAEAMTPLTSAQT